MGCNMYRLCVHMHIHKVSIIHTCVHMLLIKVVHISARLQAKSKVIIAIAICGQLRASLLQIPLLYVWLIRFPYYSPQVHTCIHMYCNSCGSHNIAITTALHAPYSPHIDCHGSAYPVYYCGLHALHYAARLYIGPHVYMRST
jgi:hypothetical protein